MTKSLRLSLLFCALGAWSLASGAVPSFTFSTLAGVAGAYGSNLNGKGGTATPTLFNNPNGLVLTSSGNLIVADATNQVLRLVSTTGEVTTYAGTPLISGNTDGTLSVAVFSNPQNPIMDSSGNIYLADYGTHTIRKITSAGVVSTFAGLAGTAGTADGTGTGAYFCHPKAVALDSSGNLYVADAGNHVIRKITSSGVVSTVAGTYSTVGTTDGTSARFYFPSGITVDSSGNIYVADTYNHTIRKVTSSGVVSTFAGYPAKLGTADGTGTAARFNYPLTLAMSPAGNILVSDFNNSTIRQITPAGVVTTLAGSPSVNDRVDGDASGTARLMHPAGLVTDSSGNIYFTDYGSSLIRKLSTSGTISTLAGVGGARGYQNGSVTMTAPALFNHPLGIAVDSSGTVYVADTYNSIIRKVTSAGVTTDWVGHSLSSGTANGTGTAAYFSSPSALSFDSSGNLYVADTGNHTIRKVSTAGVVSTLAGLAGTAGTADDTGTAARFTSPAGLTFDSSGNLYVADTGNHTIRKVTTDGVVTTFVGLAGTAGTADGTGTGAFFTSPKGIVFDSAGNLFVADSGNHLIRKVTSAGVVTTFAGQLAVYGAIDGTGTAATFNTPTSLLIDSSDNLYVCDYGSHSIRFITPAGVVTTIGGGGGPGAVNGTGTSACFYYPSAMAFDSSGNLYIADASNNMIRKGVIDGSSTNASTKTYSGTTAPTGTFSLGDFWYQTNSSGTTIAIYRWDGTQWVQIASGDTGSSSGGTGSPAVFLRPGAIAIDTSGTLYIADTGNHSIKKVTSSGVATQLAGLDGSVGTADGTGTAARFNSPAGIAVNSLTGNVWVADTGNGTIRRITPAGVVTTISGQASSRGTTDGTGTIALFQAPTGIACDGSGNVFVSDTTADTIRYIEASAHVVSTIAGSAYSVGETDGTGTSTRFSAPTGLAITTSGAAYLTDTGNHTVRSITSAGITSTFIGSAGISGAFDGTTYYALLNSPKGVHVGSSYYLYIADSGNNTIRRVTTAGYVTTLAGIAGISGYRNTAGGTPLFNNPLGVVADTDNNVFVADTGNSVIRKISYDGTVTTLTPTASTTTTTTTASSGGGGGAVSPWFLGLLAALVAGRACRRGGWLRR